MKKIPVGIELNKDGQRVLSALHRAGVDPSDALAEEIERRGKLLKTPKAKKISPRVDGKEGGRRRVR